MRAVIGSAVLAASVMLVATTAPAQQSFGEADQTGGGMGGYGQWQQAPGPQGQLGAPPNQFGNQPQPGGQYGAPQGQHGGQQGQFGAPQAQQPGQYGGMQAPYGGQQNQFGGAMPGGQGQLGGQPQQGNQGPAPGTGAINPQFAQMLDQMAQYERQDLGVPATDSLHSGAMHGPTPASIPGGQVITTKGLVELIQGQRTPYLLFDVLGSGETLPGAIPAVQASSPGSFDDQVSQQMGQFLQQATRGNAQVPLIFYCASRECWMSYNASLRAIRLGYTNVLWYRGGLEAWKQIGGPTMPAGQFPAGQQGYNQRGG